MNPKVIIGTGYGDEGKGVTTNYLSSPSSIVIRFNGGAQAGHTVVHNGFRHIFSHIGSGTLKGAKTHLSKFFICNPIGFYPEYEYLFKYRYKPIISVSPLSLVTTFYDIFINQALEDRRSQKHGSVGMGIGETIERSERRYPLFIKDLENPKTLKNKLIKIYNEWVIPRCKELGFNGIDPIISSKRNIELFIRDCQNLYHHIFIRDDEDIINNEKELIFEGAQGLMLDPEYGSMPYCTRSNCGLKNIKKLVGDKPIDVYYVSRPYSTRHGIGPLLFEDQTLSYKDDTNKENTFQGKLRFAPLNLDGITKVVSSDQQNYPCNIQNTYAVMTCLDQIQNNINVIKNGLVTQIKKEDVIKEYGKIGQFLDLSSYV